MLRSAQSLRQRIFGISNTGNDSKSRITSSTWYIYMYLSGIFLYYENFHYCCNPEGSGKCKIKLGNGIGKAEIQTRIYAGLRFKIRISFSRSFCWIFTNRDFSSWRASFARFAFRSASAISAIRFLMKISSFASALALSGYIFN